VLRVANIAVLFHRMSQLELTTSTHRIRVSDDVRYLTIGQVKRRYGGVSDMWVHRRLREGFPKPVRFGGPTSARHWLITDLEQWEHERISQARGHD
jgi:predicted DNA-binding transcriptional regulator AlpA